MASIWDVIIIVHAISNVHERRATIETLMVEAALTDVGRVKYDDVENVVVGLEM